MALCLVSAAIGLVWFSLSIFELVLLVAGPPLAAGAVALVFLAAPVAALLLRSTWPTKTVTVIGAIDADDGERLVVFITSAAERMAAKSPMTAMAFAVVGSALSVHVPPPAVPVLLRILEQISRPDGEAD